jgi:molecular chaperone GrpE
MTQDEKNKLEEEDILEEMEQEIGEIEDEEGNIDEDKLEEAVDPSGDPEEEKAKDILTRTLADFENFKKRTQRDKQDMIFFLKQDIFTKILPRLDDLERIIKNTPEEMQTGALFE